METINSTLLRSFLSSMKTLLSSRKTRKWLNFAEQSCQCPTSWRRVHSTLTWFLLLVLVDPWIEGKHNILAQDVSFLISPTMLKLDLIWLGNKRPQRPNVQAQAGLSSLHVLRHDFQTAGPNWANLCFLETTHLGLSNKPKITQFGSVNREI